ncbi:pyruvate ferredoxin oxidoreductase [Thermoanaerobacteraceae bacterium SP2]|nr:pyruvate ferredoxin oxidoreductase [Thermoanaerobacteraceae bacterium SP2]
MIEIRLHGRGGLGTVKAAEILVYAAVMAGGYGNSIPFFGFERQGAPVTSFVRISDKPIRPKNQVYHPDCVVVLEPTIMNAVDVFEGIKEKSTLVLNTAMTLEQINIPDRIKKIGIVDATFIAMELLGKPITNTIMLGSMVKSTNIVSLDLILKRVEELFGVKNVEAVQKGYELTRVYER